MLATPNQKGRLSNRRPFYTNMILSQTVIATTGDTIPSNIISMAMM